MRETSRLSWMVRSEPSTRGVQCDAEKRYMYRIGHTMSMPFHTITGSHAESDYPHLASHM